MKENRNNKIIIRVDDKEKQFIKDLATVEGITITTLIRKALRFYFDKKYNK